jgi:GNAT superfamily N-acetyltransferase
LGPDATPERPFAITARREGAVVGVATGWTQGGVAHLQNLMVDAAHRGTGIGTRLLAAFESLAVERGCRRLAVRTFAESRAHAFYRGRGWVEDVRFEPWVYGRDFVQLRRDL